MFYAGFGCITSIGVNNKMTMSSIRAGVSGYKESSHHCKEGSLATMATINEDLFLLFSASTQYMGAYTDKMDRTAKLMLYALSDLHEQKPLDSKAPLIWLEEEPHPSREPVPIEFIRDQLSYFDAPVDLDSIEVVAMGRAGGVAALRRAYDLLHQGANDYVIIGGAECPYYAPWLMHLEQRGRLKTLGSKDAFAPGEGAGFLLLSRTQELAGHCGEVPLALFLPGTAQSPAHWYNEVPDTGEALHFAMTQSIEYYEDGSGSKGEGFDHIVSSMNGESFWNKEYGVAFARLKSRLSDDCRLSHPSEYTGDLGVISGVFNIAYAVDQILEEKSQSAIVYASSDDATRAATIVSSIESGTNKIYG